MNERQMAEQIGMAFLTSLKPARKARKTKTRASKEAKPAALEPAAAPAQPLTDAEIRRAFKISDTVLQRSRAPEVTRKPNRRQARAMFAPAEPMRGVLPTGRAMAMDDAFMGQLNWASAALGSVYAEGQEFLGYPELSLMAQRPEYRRISETMATEMTRKWIKVLASGDDDKSLKIKRIEDAMRAYGVREVFKEMAEKDGFFGRSHLYLDTGDTDDRKELATSIGDGEAGSRISHAKVGKGDLKAIRSVEAVWTYPSFYNASDPLRGDFFRPLSWYVQGKEVHSSRLLTFIGRPVPDLLKPAYSFGGLALTQMAKPYVDNWLRTRQSISDLVHSFVVWVVKTDMASMLTDSMDGADLFKRVDLFNNLRDNRGVMLLDKDKEEFENVTATLAGLDHLQAQSLEQICVVSGEPLVKYTGITPSGLNASSDGEIRVWYDWILAYQQFFFAKKLRKVMNFIQLSEFGDVDPEITFEFELLWEMTPKEEAEIGLIEAQTDAANIDNGAISPLEARKRLANDPETLYPGLDADALPEGQEDDEPGLFDHPEPGEEPAQEGA
ncbi:MAG: DUF1073 domain-containing protein [Patescibacteria group bacterium]|nr:DUF1073 domain-containing protein [Patescibacteria group bacterium]